MTMRTVLMMLVVCAGLVASATVLLHAQDPASGQCTPGTPAEGKSGAIWAFA